MSDEISQQLEDLNTCDHEEEEDEDQASSSGRPPPKVALFVKAGSDGDCLGCCPFSQRLFMILWLKGVVFNVTTVDNCKKSYDLQNIAPGTKPPFLIFNDEVLTDICKCEDYIEAELYPPHYPKLAAKYPKSNTVGNDIFAKFSGFIKFRGDRRSEDGKKVEQRLIDALTKFDKYMNEPLDHEIDADEEDDKPQNSTRGFIDGDHMTIPDCNMLPKLNIIRSVGKQLANFEIPESLTGIHRYLRAAYETEEFKQTCPSDGELCWTYGGRKPPMIHKH